jgi:hypothetical protein
MPEEPVLFNDGGSGERYDGLIREGYQSNMRCVQDSQLHSTSAASGRALEAMAHRLVYPRGPLPTRFASTVA